MFEKQYGVMLSLLKSLAVNEDCFAHRKLVRQCILYCELLLEKIHAARKKRKTD